MDAIENSVKQIIIDVAQLPDGPGDLDNDSALSELGYNDAMCSDLAGRLNDFINGQGCNQLINAGDITTDSTVGEVVQLVKSNLAKCL